MMNKRDVPSAYRVPSNARHPARIYTLAEKRGSKTGKSVDDFKETL
jgi:hypothetical protein